MGAGMTTLLENYAQGLRVRPTHCVASYAAVQRRERATSPSPPRRFDVARSALGEGSARAFERAFRIGRSERQAS
jgi:hypothetical protein